MRGLASLAAGLLLASSGVAAAQSYSVALPCKATELKAAAAAERLAVTCEDGAVQIIETPTGRVVKSLGKTDHPSGAGDVNVSALSADGRRVALGFYSGTFAVWNLDDPSPPRVTKAPAYAFNLAFTRDGRVLVLGERIFDITATPRQISRFPTDFGGPNEVAFSPDGALVASANGDTTVRLLDGRTWVQRAEYRDLSVEPLAIAFVDGGRRLLAGLADGRLLLLDPRTLKPLAEAAGPAGTFVMTVTPAERGSVLVRHEPASGVGDPQWSLFDLRTAKLQPVKSGGRVAVGAVRKGRLWFYAADGLTLKIWSLAPE